MLNTENTSMNKFVKYLFGHTEKYATNTKCTIWILIASAMNKS